MRATDEEDGDEDEDEDGATEWTLRKCSAAGAGQPCLDVARTEVTRRRRRRSRSLASLA